MASLPKSAPTWVPMTVEELWEIRGTPQFEKEYRRQLEAIAEHDRHNGGADCFPTDWEWLDKVWK